MNELIGQKLRQARQGKSLTIDQVSDATYIRPRVLKALESGDFGALPSAAQVRGMLRAYADFLGLDYDELIPQHPTQTPPGDEIQAQEEANDGVVEKDSEPKLEPTPEAEQAETQPEPEGDPGPPGLNQADIILAEIGAAMKQRRDLLGLSLDEIEGHTHIPLSYLEMIEEGNLHHFPSPTQARGMLGMYAEFLNMDTNAVLMRYAEALQTRLAIQQAKLEETRQRPLRPSRARRPILPAWLRQIISPDVLIYGAIGLVVVLFAAWGIGRVLTTRASIEPQPTAPPLAQILLPSATTESTPTATVFATDEPGQPGEDNTENEAFVNELAIEEEEEATPEVTVPPFAGETFQIYIVVRQRAYLKVIVDGNVEFNGRVNQGDNLPFAATSRIELLTGNAAALQVFYNETDLGTMGIFGQVANEVYTHEGAQTPTPTITPTLRPELITPSPTPTTTEAAP